QVAAHLDSKATKYGDALRPEEHRPGNCVHPCALSQQMATIAFVDQ
ncbi:MAG: hypothetical protein ACI841_004860, partial [Planctomycetota bacterium]